MKARNIYIFSVLVIMVIVIIAESNAPMPIDWEPSYSKYDNIPYGDDVVYNMLPDLFPGKKITVSDKPLYTAFDTTLENTNAIIINRTFEPDSLDAIKLMSYVARGNNAVIAAEQFYGTFADSLKISTEYSYEYSLHNSDSITLSILDSTDEVYAYKQGSVQYYFFHSDTLLKNPKTVLSKNSNGRDVFIAIKFGKGTFYLSSVPLAFTNYNILKNTNYEYISRCLSYLPVADTYWDEHYKEISHEASTPLRYILSSKSLRFAYYISILGIILYLFFEGKRRQRIVPVITPLKNTSVDFTETIGRLYYEKGNNLGIAKKRIAFLMDTIRTQYKITVDETSPYFFPNLATKTLISKEELEELFTFIRFVQAQNDLTQDGLLKLNNMLEKFYNKTA